MPKAGWSRLGQELIAKPQPPGGEHRRSGWDPKSVTKSQELIAKPQLPDGEHRRSGWDPKLVTKSQELIARPQLPDGEHRRSGWDPKSVTKSIGPRLGWFSQSTFHRARDAHADIGAPPAVGRIQAR